MIRIISLDARHPNVHLRCRVCLLSDLSLPALSLSDGPPVVPAFVTPHVQRRPEIINETSGTLPTLCARLIIPWYARLSADTQVPLANARAVQDAAQLSISIEKESWQKLSI